MAFTAANLTNNPKFNNTLKDENIAKEKQLKFEIYKIITKNTGCNKDISVTITNEIVKHILDKGIKL